MKKIILFINVFISLSILTSCDRFSGGEVKYVVDCSENGFDITYQNSSGSTAQQQINSSSWTHTFNGNYGDFVYISAQAMNENTVISTKIYYKDKLFKSSTSYGDYVIAEAYGNLKNVILKKEELANDIKNNSVEIKAQEQIDNAIIPSLP
tara:strand:+ start:387 stop:839 length:453 start_codon:yes stop_codon:yes gene_type:complete